MKYFLGIDIGKFKHVACLINDQGNPVDKPITFSTNLAGWQKLLKHINNSIDYRDYPSIQAGFEATRHYWLTLYSKLKELGVSISVLNPLEVKAFRSEGIRGSKTDKIDAVKIARLLRFGNYRSTYVPDKDFTALRQLVRLKTDLVNMTTKLKQKVIGILDTVFPEYQTLFTDTFGITSKTLLSKTCLPEEIVAIPTSKLTRLLKQVSRGQYGSEKAEIIKNSALSTMGITIGLDAFSLSVKILLSQIDHLDKQIKQLEKEINRRTENISAVLTTIPGIGKSIAGTILAEVGDIKRFIGKDGAEKLVALAGLDAKLKESGQYQGKAKMSKRGSGYLRSAVRQASFVAVMVSKDPMFTKIYQKQINKGKHMEVALSHVERKMIHVIYSVLKNNKSYVPNI